MFEIDFVFGLVVWLCDWVCVLFGVVDFDVEYVGFCVDYEYVVCFYFVDWVG